MTLPVAVNCSIMMKELPIPERLARAADAGFGAVEFWWPFETADPPPAQVDGFVNAVERSGLQLVGLNLFAGDMGGGDRGVVSWPGREAEVEASARTAADVAGRLGTRVVNALYGNRLGGADPGAQDALAVRNLRTAAHVVAEVGCTVVVEPVSGAPRYPLRTAADVLAVLDRVAENGGPELLLLLDVYHLAVNGDDVDAAIGAHLGRVGHVQVADAPGRGAPGTGELPLGAWLERIEAGGYTGHVAFEHVDAPGGPSPRLAAAGAGVPR